MGILKSALTIRRYDVIGDLPKDYLVSLLQSFEQYAFRSDRILQSKEESIGWTTIHNLLEADFSDYERWFFEPFVVAMMRVDQKSLPSNLFQAHFRQKLSNWCKENDKKTCPSRVKEEIKDNLKFEMYSKSLPKVKTVDFCWHLEEKWLLFHNLSDGMNDRFVKIFHESFGLQLAPVSPLDWVQEDSRVSSYLQACGASDLSFVG